MIDKMKRGNEYCSDMTSKYLTVSKCPHTEPVVYSIVTPKIEIFDHIYGMVLPAGIVVVDATKSSGKKPFRLRTLPEQVHAPTWLGKRVGLNSIIHQFNAAISN